MKIITISPIVARQISEVVALDKLCFGGLWNEAGYLRELESPNSSLIALSVAESVAEKNCPDINAKIIGICCLWSIVEEAHFTLLGVHPNYRGQGLGELLLYILFRDAVNRRLKWATLEVKANNYPAISLYQKSGFKVAGRRKGYYQPEGEDALILWNKDLEKPEFSQYLTNWQKKIDNQLSSRYILTWAIRSTLFISNTP